MIICSAGGYIFNTGATFPSSAEYVLFQVDFANSDIDSKVKYAKRMTLWSCVNSFSACSQLLDLYDGHLYWVKCIVCVCLLTASISSIELCYIVANYFRMRLCWVICDFASGFNCAEAVNFAPPDWLPWGCSILNKYRRDGKAATLSNDALLIALVKVSK